MREYFRKVAVNNGLIPRNVMFKSNDPITTSTLSDKRERGSLLPATGPLEGCILGVKPTRKNLYARVIAFSINSPSETCEKSLMVTAQREHVPAIELIFDLEPNFREKITSIVVYEVWSRKSCDRYDEKITIEPIGDLIHPLKPRFAQLEKERFSCIMCDNAEILKETPVGSGETLYAPSFFLYQGKAQIGMATLTLLPALQTGLRETSGLLLSHVLIIDGPAVELRLNRDFYDPKPRQLALKMA